MASARRSVLLCVSNPSRSERLRQALTGEHDALSVGRKQEVIPALVGRRVDLIVLEGPAATEEFLAEIESVAPGTRRLVISSEQDVDRLIETMASGHEFVPVFSTNTMDMAADVALASSPRKWVRHPVPAGMTVALIRGGESQLFPLTDIANHGLSLLVPPTEELEPYLPGTSIAPLTVHRGNELVMENVAAVSRHVVRLGDGSCRVGLQLVDQAWRDRQKDRAPVLEGVRKASLLRRALRQGTLRVQRVDSPMSPEPIRSGRLELRAGRMTLVGAFPGVEVGDVVRGFFELEGASYSFLTAVMELPAVRDSSGEGPITIRIPRGIRARRWRGISRYRPAEEIVATVWSPFQTRPLSRPVIDVNTTGLSLAIDPHRDLCPVGTAVKLAISALSFGGGPPETFRGKVRSLTPLPSSGRGELKCGIQFEGLSTAQAVRIADAILHNNVPTIDDARTTPLPEIWAFLERAGFLYPEKLEALKPELSRIHQTLSTLLRQENHLLKTVLIREGGEIQGHLSAVRTYGRTWMVQHLAALKHGKALFAARLLNLGFAQYLEQIPDLEWLKVFFRPDNKWPARVFGTFARALTEPELSDFRTYHYLTAPLEGTQESPPPAPAGSTTIRPATAADLAPLERLFVERGMAVQLRSDDLSRSGILLEGLSAGYRALGLERRREVLVAERAGERVGFALLEISSPGLNLSDLTNRFTIHLEESGLSAAGDLIAAAQLRYRELGRTRCIALADDASLLPAFHAAGFQSSKEYCCWTWHRSLLRRYYEYIFRLFGRSRPEGRMRQ